MAHLHRSTTITLLSIALLFAASQAEADLLLYETGFEPPEFTIGTLAGQDGFTADFSPDAAVVSTTLPRSGEQSVEIMGQTLEEVADGLFFGEYAKPLNYDASAALPIVEIAADIRLDGPETALDVLGVNLGAFTPAGDTLGDIFISSTGSVFGLTDPFGDTVLTTPAGLDRYFRLGMRVDFEARTTEFFLDGASMGVLSIPESVTSNILGTVSLAMVSFADASDTANYTGYVDNLTVTAIPEPSACVLMGLGGLGLLGLARRRRS